MAKILSPDQFVPQLTATDRWGVIDTLVTALTKLGKVRPEDRAAIAKALKEREASKSTGIGFGIAIPHASVACIQDVVAIVARLQPPVDFQALDDQPVKLCVLFLTPQGQFQKHLHALAAFARFLSDKEHRQKLEAAPTAQEMYTVFTS